MDTRNGNIYFAELDESEAKQSADRDAAFLKALERIPVLNKEDITYIEPMKHWPSPLQRAKGKVGRNDPCPCGSRKKFKKCCLFRG